MTLRVEQRWERRFPAMGTQCHVVVEGAPASLLDLAQQRVLDLQALWTRFETTSETSRLSRRGHGVVSPQTFHLVACGLLGWRWTRGTFNPFMADEVAALGYDRDFDELPVPTGREPLAAPARWVLRPRPVISLNRRTRTVVLAPGASLDSGGLGKGLAADLVSAELIGAGARACLVNLGGDLRVRGQRRKSWIIDIAAENDRVGSPVAIRLRAGGLATSSTVRRRWRAAAGQAAHHLLDPRSGAPLETPLTTVSVVAPAGWVAEVLSKAAFVQPRPRTARLLQRHRAAAVLQYRSGEVEQLPNPRP